MKKFKKFSLLTLLILSLAGLFACAGAWYWTERPVAMDGERIDYLVEAGNGPADIARVMNDAGIHIHTRGFSLLARLSGQDKQLKAGAYEARRGDTPITLLQRMANGDMTQSRLTFVEGWTYKRIRQALRDSPDVRQTLDGISDAALLKRLGSNASSPEGLFYPDTYVFTPGTTDFDILRRAYHAGQDLLARAWSEREPGLPLASPYDALVLASIVEKETGNKADRTKVAGVFINRLRSGMPLQTDPTVIYGLGSDYSGRLRKKDLAADTPWNTYTRSGLPPTPIASPGRASLLAVLHPDSHGYYYFVARGDGTSEFSTNLAAHNRAVSKFILGRN